MAHMSPEIKTRSQEFTRKLFAKFFAKTTANKSKSGRLNTDKCHKDCEFLTENGCKAYRFNLILGGICGLYELNHYDTQALEKAIELRKIARMRWIPNEDIINSLL